MKRIIVLFVSILLTGVAGCGGCSKTTLNTAPLSDEEKAQIQEQDRQVEDDERRGSGTAVPRKGR
jgi:hypothetical protein